MSPNQASASRRIRYILMTAGALAVASAPFLVMGQQAPEPPAPSAEPAVASPPAAETEAEAEPPTAPGEEHLARAYHRVATGPDDGAEPVEPPDFECKPVRRDQTVGDEEFPVPLPPFSRDVFPCTRCHDKPEDFNAEKRTLTLDHLDIKLVHGPREQWCYGCHNPTDRDTLRLAGGRTVSFLKSYELCGQCHGTKLRDWRVGIHGRRTGCWNGKREYLLCVHCHNPHAPKFEPLKPMPRPKRPSEIGSGGGKS